MVDDENDSYQCYGCYATVRFFECPRCGFRQTVMDRWDGFTCGRCESSSDLPKRRTYGTSVKAGRVEGVGRA
jgi:hypothetical protein